jgi:hypothetical protein
MFRCNIVRLRLGRHNPGGVPITSDNYMQIPSAPLSGSYVSTHTPADSGTNTGLQVQSSYESICSRPSVYGQLSSLAWKIHQHPSGEIYALSDSQVNLPFCANRQDITVAAKTARNGVLSVPRHWLRPRILTLLLCPQWPQQHQRRQHRNPRQRRSRPQHQLMKSQLNARFPGTHQPPPQDQNHPQRPRGPL